MGTICIAFPYLLVMLNIFLRTCQSFSLPHLWTNCLCPFFFIGFPSCWDLQICSNYLSISLLLVLNVYLSQREKYLLISSIGSFTKLKSLNVIESKLFYLFLVLFFLWGHCLRILSLLGHKSIFLHLPFLALCCYLSHFRTLIQSARSCYQLAFLPITNQPRIFLIYWSICFLSSYERASGWLRPDVLCCVPAELHVSSHSEPQGLCVGHVHLPQ